MWICWVTIIPTLVFLAGTEGILLEPVRQCVPTASVRGPGYMCVCSTEGVFHCQPMKQCNKQIANVTKHQPSKLPEIKEGMKCIPGKLYKMDCNTCRCGSKNSLLCTKVLCLGENDPRIVVLNNKRIARTRDNDDLKVDDADIPITKKKKVRKFIKKQKSRVYKTDTVGFPSLPPSKICIPGKIYQDECKRCFCKANRQPVCSTTNSCTVPKVPRELTPEDVRPRVKDKEFNKLPELPHAAAACTPGVTYKVDCNVCVCDEYQNLMCDRLMCISFADMNKAEALSKSGLPCNVDNEQENQVLQSKCVECKCNVTTYCHPKADCVTETETVMRTTRRNGSRLTFDLAKDNCIPDHIYKDNCNKCYCQKDQSLRCTGKTCLNYSQSRILEKQHEYLRRHGL